MLQNTAQQLDAWRTEIKVYEKNKRTKRPFGRSLPKAQFVTHEDIKNKQLRFHPILQNYKNSDDEVQHHQKEQLIRAKSLMNHIKQNTKHEKPYDIVNCYGKDGRKSLNELSSIPNKKLGPITNAYNVINNQMLPDFFFKNRDLRLPVQRQKNLFVNNVKEYNIVTGVYKQNHEERIKNEENNEKQIVMKKYWKTHNYNPVFEKEQKYQQERMEKEKVHGQDQDKNLPPSYVLRQPFIPDPTKPLPASLQTLDEKNLNSKKRYQLKYCILDEYSRRNIEDDNKYESVIKNRVHNGRILQQKIKEFNIITTKEYPESRAEQLFNKELVKNSWEKLNSATGKIKSIGFQK